MSVIYLFRDTVHSRRHDRCPTGQSFKNGAREGIRLRRVDIHVSRLIEASDGPAILFKRNESYFTVAKRLGLTTFSQNDDDYPLTLETRTDVYSGGMDCLIILKHVPFSGACHEK